MTRSANSCHVLELIPDYVLGILPGNDAEWVDAHLSACGECRRALAMERKIARSVKSTLAAASAPDKESIRRLMPATPAPVAVSDHWPRLSPGLAAAAIMLLLAFGTIALFASQRPGAWGFYGPTSWSTAVVYTDTPTQTATREITATAEGLEAFASPAPVNTDSGTNLTAPLAPAMVPVPAAPLLQ